MGWLLYAFKTVRNQEIEGASPRVVVDRPQSSDLQVESIPFRMFFDQLLKGDFGSQMPADLQVIACTVKEVLFSGEANRVVAELANVHIDGLASPSIGLSF